MQLLWINLVTDSLPAIALGMEPVEKDVMLRRPKPKNESIFSGGFGAQILLQGVMFAALKSARRSGSSSNASIAEAISFGATSGASGPNTSRE